MLKLGTKVKVIKRPNNSAVGRTSREEKQGYINALTKHLITVMYTKDGQDTYKESINVADIIENKIELQIMNNKEWVKATLKDFRILKRSV